MPSGRRQQSLPSSSVARCCCRGAAAWKDYEGLRSKPTLDARRPRPFRSFLCASRPLCLHLSRRISSTTALGIQMQLVRSAGIRFQQRMTHISRTANGYSATGEHDHQIPSVSFTFLRLGSRGLCVPLFETK